MADQTISVGDTSIAVNDLIKMGVDELVCVLEKLNTQREKAKSDGRIVKEILSRKLSNEALISKLAGLHEDELNEVMSMIQGNPKALAEAVAKSRSRRPVLEVDAGTSSIELEAKTSGK